MGLCAHNVANRLSALVTKTATKSVTRWRNTVLSQAVEGHVRSLPGSRKLHLGTKQFALEMANHFAWSR
jgi:hypothetical protein